MEQDFKAVMKALCDPKTKERIIERLQSIAPTSARRWGRMSCHQMVCHLADSLRGVIGEKHVSEAPSLLPRRLVKWIALDVPLAWPKGFQTRPEMNQELGGTPPTEFAADLHVLQLLLDRFTRSPRDFAWHPHPIFGPMSDHEWMRWGYLHLDHHLRQFGA
jgi:Protein of unknown function (DUF1569)